MFETGQNIKVIRELRNFTQDYVASQLHMSVSNYSNIETGKTDLTIGRLQAIARVFEIEMHQIIFLNRSQLLEPANGARPHTAGANGVQVKDELIHQLQIKDEQINRLLVILEKAKL